MCSALLPPFLKGGIQRPPCYNGRYSIGSDPFLPFNKGGGFHGLGAASPLF